MVKAVIGEETQLPSAENRVFQSRIAAEVGLVIGKLSSALDRGFVFDLVPTPLNDAGEPACSISEVGKDERKKGSKGKSQVESPVLLVDQDWVVEHARQVSTMLLGGVNVVGVYIWASESSFKASSTVLWQTVKGVAEAAPLYDSDLDERLLIHISYSPRRWTCRSCLLSSSMTSTNLKLCDFKMGKLLSTLQTFRCTYNFEIRVPICAKDVSSAYTFRDILLNGISSHAKELKGAKALVDGDLVVRDQQSTSDNIHEVELLLPFMRGPPEAFSTEEITGLVILSGSVYSSAYLSPKESVLRAISDIKGDIIASLRSRLDIICDEAEEDAGPAGDGCGDDNEIPNEKSLHQFILHKLRKPCSLSFPRRVLVPWVDGILICDYLQPSETSEDVMARCREIMSMEFSDDALKMLEPEEEAAPQLTSKLFWDVVVHGNSASKDVVHGNSASNSSQQPIEKIENGYSQGEGSSSRSKSNSNVIVSIIIAIIAILLALEVFVKPAY